ncbi:MAG TPA: primosomal protein, partial [Microbacterium sp.]|nr:primosomal protein [Microbacterium sp.]
AKRDGDHKPYAKRDGDHKPYPKRDGDRSARPTRGGANRPDRAVRDGEIRPVRARHADPVLPEDVTGRDLPPAARNELKTLSKENAEEVARHLVMASQLIDEDPALAHQHALSASRRAGRIAVVRETLAITAYATGDFALALRELRTYRRISGRDDQIALMVDSERGVGRADRALEVGRAVDRSTLDTPVRVELAIAMSGARLDLGEPERALQELDIPELDPDRAFEWSPALFAARAAVLEELGRTDEAAQWQRRAVIAAEAIDAASGVDDLETVFVEEVIEMDLDEDEDEHTDDAGEGSETPADPGESETSENVDESASPAAEPEDISVADEVAELLVEAGVDEPGDDEADR